MSDSEIETSEPRTAVVDDSISLSWRPVSAPVTLQNHSSVLDLQIEMLKKEYDMVQQEIREFSKKSANCRNWTITLWAGSIAFSISPSQGDAQSFVLLSTIFPLMFWVQDVRWTQLQRIFIFRGKIIMDFFGSDFLIESKRRNQLIGISLSGFRKDLNRELFRDEEYRSFSSFWRVAFFSTKMSFYPVLMLGSASIHAYFNFADIEVIYRKLILITS